MLTRRLFLRVVLVGGAVSLAAAPSLAEALQLVLPSVPARVADYEIRLFGSVQVEAFGRKIEKPLDRRAMQFLSIVALNPDGISFEDLHRRLELSPRGVVRSFNILQAQHAVDLTWAGPQLLKVSNRTVRLNPDLEILVDADLWNQLLDRADGDRRIEVLQMAIRLYRGPLLRGLQDPSTLDLRSQYRLEFASVAAEVAAAIREADPEHAEVLERRGQHALANEWAARANARQRVKRATTVA